MLKTSFSPRCRFYSFSLAKFEAFPQLNTFPTLVIFFRVSPSPQISVSKAPAPHPHTLDPFQEVKEYMLEAEDYAHFLNDKVNVSMPSYPNIFSGHNLL